MKLAPAPAAPIPTAAETARGEAQLPPGFKLDAYASGRRQRAHAAASDKGTVFVSVR